MRVSSRWRLIGASVALLATLAGLTVLVVHARQPKQPANGPPVSSSQALGHGGVFFPSDSPAPAATVAPAATPVPTATPNVNRLPERLSIPALNVNAAIEPVTVDAQGNMDVPKLPEDVAWYSKGPFPGDPGDAVMAGHLDWTNGPAVFAHLSQLKPGDEITVQRPNGASVHFKVTSTKVYPSSAHPADLFVTGGPARLSLITCTGPWDVGARAYQERLVVDSTLITG